MQRFALLRRKHNAGFFSHVCTAIDMAIAAREHGLIPIVDQQQGMRDYRTSPQENVWDTFFLQPYSPSEVLVLHNPVVINFNHWKRSSDPNEIPIRPRHKERPFHYESFVTIRSGIYEYAQMLQERYLGSGDYNCCYFRGTDKKREFPEAKFTAYQELLLGTKLPLLVQTDDIRFINFAKQVSPNCVVIPEFGVSTDGVPMHKTDSICGYKKGIDALAIMLLIAGAEKAIASRSNVTCVACYHRTSTFPNKPPIELACNRKDDK